MAISGFGNCKNLNLRTSLNVNQGKKVEDNETKTPQTGTERGKAAAPETSLEAVKFDHVGSLFIRNGVKINNPVQPEPLETPLTEVKPVGSPTIEASHFDFDTMEDFYRTFGKGIYKRGDTIHIKDSQLKLTYRTVFMDGKDAGLFQDDVSGELWHDKELK